MYMCWVDEGRGKARMSAKARATSTALDEERKGEMREKEGKRREEKRREEERREEKRRREEMC
jgi:hypothetical protein